jgi:hypothetical protein
VDRPSSYNLTIIRRSTFRLPIQLLESKTTAPLDITNKNLISQLWNRTRTEKYLDVTVRLIEADRGLIELIISAEQTVSLPRVGVYDLKTLNEDGSEYFYLAGGFTLKEGYTEGKVVNLVKWVIDNENTFDNFFRDAGYYRSQNL